MVLSLHCINNDKRKWYCLSVCGLIWFSCKLSKLIYTCCHGRESWLCLVVLWQCCLVVYCFYFEHLLSFQLTCLFPLCFSCQSDCLPFPDCSHLFPITVCIYGLCLPLFVASSSCLAYQRASSVPSSCQEFSAFVPCPSRQVFVLFFDTLSSPNMAEKVFHTSWYW